MFTIANSHEKMTMFIWSLTFQLSAYVAYLFAMILVDSISQLNHFSLFSMRSLFIMSKKYMHIYVFMYMRACVMVCVRGVLVVVGFQRAI